MTAHEPLVSVIVIFLNGERYIEEAIESVFAQSYRNWELLLVDDGSTDGSSAIARCYAGRHPERVRYLAHEGNQNRGMSASRNLGIRHASGDYIAFLDADDVWLPHKLERQVAALEARPDAGMAYGPTQWWYSWTGNAEDCHRDFIHDMGVPPNRLLEPPELLARFLRAEGTSPCTCSVLLRRSVAERVGGFEEQFRGMYEDQAFFAKVALETPVLVLPDCLARYRQHPQSGSVATLAAGRHAATRRQFLEWLQDYLTRRQVQDHDLWRALRRELWPVRNPRLHRAREWLYYSPPGKVWRLARRLSLRWPSLPILRHLRALQLRRLRPFGDGKLRGTPVVRWYWRRFLDKHRADIRGDCLEVGTTETIRQLGGAALTRADAIDLVVHSPEVALVADLSRADHLSPDQYDCFVNQFTMHLIYDVESALYHAIRLLKPGGVLLVNFPCVDYYFPRGLDMGTGAPLFLYWWFTPIQIENLLRRLGLTGEDYQLEIYGNLFTRVAYQMNMPAEELTRRELEHVDPGHPLLLCARVVKPANWRAERPLEREPWLPPVTPAHWNPESGHYGT
jgi:glycosyltransferase involved in cell wall biosynthesis